jgi:hypothetical protein
VNKETYIDVLRRIRDAARKRSEEYRTNSWLTMLQHTGGFLIHDFLSKNNVTTLEIPPCSPNLALADYCLSPQLKSALKLRRMRDANDIIKNATEELKRFPQNGFQICFIHIYIH